MLVVLVARSVILFRASTSASIRLINTVKPSELVDTPPVNVYTLSESPLSMFGWKDISLGSSVETTTTSEKFNSRVLAFKSRMNERTVGPSSSSCTDTA